MATGGLKDMQVIYHDGEPTFAVVPYEKWQKMIKVLTHLSGRATGVPDVIAVRVLHHQVSPMKAWREYLGLTQTAMAKRLDISQAAYSQLERRVSHRPETLHQVADAMNLTLKQLDW